MEFFLIILLLIAIIGLSNILNHFTPFIPVPIIQISLGALLALMPLGIHIQLEPELFFVLFIAPLLFHDGKNVPRAALWKLRRPILLLALGLVFVTVFAIGYLIHWLIPSIPLPAAFALAAILSPTDVVAVGAISSRVKMPKDIMHLLEGEGLMNDASGLVAFKFAIAATVTGMFSFTEASWSFLVIAIGGFAGGAILAFLIIRLRIFIRKLGMEDVTVHMIIQILTPFVIFLAIEHFHLSGILSVVAAGIVHAIERDREESPVLQLQIVSKSTWTVIIYILNGLVFVLLGLQIPSVAREIFEDPTFNNFVVIWYILIITTSLLFLRFLWIYVSWSASWMLKKYQVKKPGIRPIGITTISGVRGAVTLAGAFSIPYVIADGSPFPERSLIIFIAAGVILVTLLAASILLPILAKTEKGKMEEKKVELERIAMIRSYDAAIKSVRELMNEENQVAALAVISSYNQTRNNLKYIGNEENMKNSKQNETEIRMKALDAESDYITKLKKEGKIDRELVYLLEGHIHRMRSAVTNQMKYRSLMIWKIFNRSVYLLALLFMPNKQERRNNRSTINKKLLRLKLEMAELAIRVVKEELTKENEDVSLLVIGDYSKLISKMKRTKKITVSKVFTHVERELQNKAFQAERDEVQNLYEQGFISMDLTRKLRKHINIREAYWMEESSLHQ
ncbi:Na+/H+ antiporter [Paenisporosarcina indica]|uniref:Na+/H+ antiporter n=1 Tax=Paenisporosarcina indica TaxID=650093 RepID=UPI00095013D3|nr:Na+/H+ antiporter [Paenisporosarcina indica]